MHRPGKRFLALGVALLLSAGVLPAGPTSAQAAAPVRQGFTVTPADLAFILKQINISEGHVANTTSDTGPCGALLGSGPTTSQTRCCPSGYVRLMGHAITSNPDELPFGSSDQRFPRLTEPVFFPCAHRTTQASSRARRTLTSWPHDRLLADIKNTPDDRHLGGERGRAAGVESGAGGGRLERRASLPGRAVRHRDGVPDLVFEELARKVQPAIE